MFQLKEYQRRCLDELAQYLRRVIALGHVVPKAAKVAFEEKEGRGAYRDVGALPGLPYVCVRLPTGGGKTVLAAHAVGITCKELLRRDRCMVLWLAPTTQIVEQTLKALRDKRHPYRQALDEAFAGCVSVMDLKAAMGLSRSTLESDTVVIVSTLAAMRVENTDGRKIYEANGQLMACFEAATKEQLAVLGPGNGTDPTVPTLANLLRLHRPLVIVDEAHNARTHLSFDTLARFKPSCIVEFSATPDQDPKGDPSNVLTHVSAADLKIADMIKLPIRLKAREQWKTGALDLDGSLWGQRVSEPVSTAPAVKALPGELRAKLTVREEGAAAELVYEGPPMSENDALALKAVFEKKEDKEAVERLCRKSRGEDASPAAMGKVLAVPALAIREGKQLELFEDQFLDTQWSLGDFGPALGEAEFKIDAGPRQVAIVDANADGKIVADFVPELERQLTLLDLHAPKTETELAVWLDRAIEHPDTWWSSTRGSTLPILPIARRRSR